MIPTKAKSSKEIPALVTKARRPILTHLNADTCWLLSIPTPHDAISSRASKAYFHIIIDPWLKYTASLELKLYMTFTHTTESAFQTIASVDKLISEIEEAAGATFLKTESKTGFDAIVIVSEGPDHTNKPTLLEFDPSVPVLAVPKAADLIKSWKYFKSVSALPETSDVQPPNWRLGSVSPLPDWISIMSLPDKTWVGIHGATLFAFAKPDGSSAEAVLYTQHGISFSDPYLKNLRNANPPIEILALLHGLVQSTSLVTANLGAHNGLAVVRETGAKYWVPTHDEDLKVTGLVKMILTRKPVSVKDALEREKERDGLKEIKGVDFVEVDNGESFLLE